MQKLVFALFIFSFSSAFAVVSVDQSEYTAPANVTVSGGDGSNRFNVYYEGEWICQWDPAASNGTLSTYCDGDPAWTGDSWAIQSSTLGAYSVVLQTVTDCNGVSYATCSATNPNIPGSMQADFDIVDNSSSSPTSTNATSSMTEFEMLISYWLLSLTLLVIASSVAYFLTRQKK